MLFFYILERLSFLTRIINLNGIFNLNPYECRESFIKLIKLKSNKKNFKRLKFIQIIIIVLKNYKSLITLYKRFLDTKSKKNSLNLTANNIFISYEDAKSSSNQEDKYFNGLKKELNKKAKNNYSEVHIDVIGSEPTKYSILHLVNYLDAIYIFNLSQLIFILILLKYIFFELFSNNSLNKNILYEILNHSSIFRFIIWDFAFIKLFKKLNNNTKITFLLEGSSWEWLMLYHCPEKNIISGFVHAISRPQQYSLYQIINSFYKEKNLRILVSDIWSYDRININCNLNLIYKVENLRFKTFKSEEKSYKATNDLLIIGGLDGDLSKDLMRDLLIYLKKSKSPSLKIIFKTHPGNKLIFPEILPENFIDGSNFDLNLAIKTSKNILVSGYSAACIDVMGYGKTPFIYLPNKYLDLCPLPEKDRNIILSEKKLFYFLNNLEKENKSAIKFKSPFFLKDKNLTMWKSLY